MSESCQKHHLALSPEGICVLCRRESAPGFAIGEETEALISKLFTSFLGLGLLCALVALLYIWGLDAGYAGGRYSLRPALGSMDSHAALGRTEPNQPLRTRERPATAPGAATFANKSDDRRAAIAHTLVPTKPEGRALGVTAETQTQALHQQTAATEPARRVVMTMYSAPWCYICDRARDFLLARDVALIDRNVEREAAAARRLGKLNHAQSLPTFELAEHTYVGFNPWELQDAIRAAQGYHTRAP